MSATAPARARRQRRAGPGTGLLPLGHTRCASCWVRLVETNNVGSAFRFHHVGASFFLTSFLRSSEGPKALETAFGSDGRFHAEGGIRTPEGLRPRAVKDSISESFQARAIPGFATSAMGSLGPEDGSL